MTETGKPQEAGQKLEVKPAKQNILRLMEMEGQAMNQEEQHLQSCCQMIRENIRDYEIKVTKGRKEKEELYAAVQSGQVDVYDAASLALIQKRITEKEDKSHYGQIIIDEAQDFGVMVYYVLKKILPKCYFTIMGDVSQNIHYETGMNDWDELCSHIFEPDKEKFYILAKSYRNTIEISKYAGKVLERASYGTYKIQPVIRHGMEVQHWKTGKESMYRQAADIIGQIRDRGYDTTAVICRTSQEAVLVEEGLKNYLDVEKGEDMNFKKGVMVLPIELTKGLEFDTVILWNPDESRYGENQGEAKLLYVAITRALHELHIIYSETLSKLFV